jgi:hypothetical protein
MLLIKNNFINLFIIYIYDTKLIKYFNLSEIDKMTYNLK